MGEREARHAGDSSVIQQGMKIIHYLSSDAGAAVSAAFAASALALAAAACFACISLNFLTSSAVGTGSMQPFGQALVHILQFLHLVVVDLGYAVDNVDGVELAGLFAHGGSRCSRSSRPS